MNPLQRLCRWIGLFGARLLGTVGSSTFQVTYDQDGDANKLLAPNPRRVGIIIEGAESSADLYLLFDGTNPSSSKHTLKVIAGEREVLTGGPFAEFTGEIYYLFDSTSQGKMQVTELSKSITNIQRAEAEL